MEEARQGSSERLLWSTLLPGQWALPSVMGLLIWEAGEVEGSFCRPQSNCGAPDRHSSPEPWLVLWTPPCCQLDQNGPHS